ncbi:hypothetical protein ABZ464_31510 [Streptomyces sp. NPDC005820]|uniref:hypothetical protein n=1 Tax=Streptomyces sp. NPDC005820 TaxID=3157069 RepID=UPI0033DB089D
MTTTPSRPDISAADTGTAAGPTRLLAAGVAGLGPLLLAVGTALTPYRTDDSDQEIVRAIAGHRTTAELTQWFWIAGSILLVLGTVLVGLVAVRCSPKLGLWGGLAFGTGLLAIASTPSLDLVVLGGLDQGVSQKALVATADGTYALALTGVPTFYFVVAHVVGAILLGVALLRGRAIPVWAAWVLILSMPLNVVGYVGGIMPLTVATFVMLGVGFAFGAVCLPAAWRGALAS